MTQLDHLRVMPAIRAAPLVLASRPRKFNPLPLTLTPVPPVIVCHLQRQLEQHVPDTGYSFGFSSQTG